MLTKLDTPSSGGPLRPHGANPHYLEYKGKPILLISSAEHYGAVLNRAFDFEAYLESLAFFGFNLTRTFMGAYVEYPGWFEFPDDQPLNPTSDSFICPWAHSSVPGYRKGGNKFDLSAWNPEFFERLKCFVETAEKAGIMVEISFFTPYYNNELWEQSPLYADNNINGVGTCRRELTLTNQCGENLLKVQFAYVEKIVRELNGFNNIYFEVVNEPYIDPGAEDGWHQNMIQYIVDIERSLPKQHLLAWNITNGAKAIENPNPHCSIFNFHYPYSGSFMDDDPAGIPENYALGKVIACDETGIAGNEEAPYRREAWEAIHAGCGIMNNLDSSYTVADPKGIQQPVTRTNGGGAILHFQYQFLIKYLENFEFARMVPSNHFLLEGCPSGGAVRILAEPGVQYSIYVRGGSQATVLLDIPVNSESQYRSSWFCPQTGRWLDSRVWSPTSGGTCLKSPVHKGEIALSIHAN